ncbi:ABC transporter ATP-binding protein [Microbacterium tumbae]
MPLLRVRDLALTHAGSSRPSPQGVSFDVDAGEVVLLLGPSGSGKSTLTLALNGLIPQSVPAAVEGSVEVGGRSTLTTPVASLSTDIAMVFQDPDAQQVTGTVLDEVAFALENLLLPVSEILARAEAALRRVGLWERREENPDRLSGGGRQRLAIACALAMGSPIIVLDEPTANLDPQGIDDVYDALADLVATGDRAIVLVEHNLDAAMRFATRVLVLDREGRLVFDGPAREVLRERTEELVTMGVWLPAAMLAGRMLRSRGVLPPDAPLPLTPEELVSLLPRSPGGDIPRTLSEDGAAGSPRTLSEDDEAPSSRTLSEAGAADRVETQPETRPVSTRSARSTNGRGTDRSNGRGTARSNGRGADRSTDGRRAEVTDVGRIWRESPDIRPSSLQLSGHSPQAIIRTRGLTVERGRREILHGIDLDLPAGSLTAIVGANGAGKTTLIQALAGVVPPPRHQVSVDGLDPATASPREFSARIGFVFQNPEHQFIAHTVFDELAHGLRLRKADEAEIVERVEGMLRRFGLSDKADVHPFLLSGGEKRRLSVGTALIAQPRVLALDEPTFGQDRARADELLRLLDELRAEGTTILIVTHDLQLVADHASHTVILAQGRVHADGETPRLFATEGLFEDAGLRLPPLHRALPSALRQLVAEEAR